MDTHTKAAESWQPRGRAEIELRSTRRKWLVLTLKASSGLSFIILMSPPAELRGRGDIRVMLAPKEVRGGATRAYLNVT
jgi:hypothetical protein